MDLFGAFFFALTETVLCFPQFFFRCSFGLPHDSLFLNPFKKILYNVFRSGSQGPSVIERLMIALISISDCFDNINSFALRFI